MTRKDGFLGEIESDEVRRQLVALRDLVAHELTVNRCDKCRALQLRTGDTAALVLRLQTLIREIEALPAEQEGTELDRIRQRRAAGNVIELRPGAGA